MKNLSLDKTAEEIAVDLVHLRTIRDLEGVSDEDYKELFKLFVNTMIEKIKKGDEVEHTKHMNRVVLLRNDPTNFYKKEEEFSKDLSNPVTFLADLHKAGYVSEEKYVELNKIYLDAEMKRAGK